MNKQVTTRFLGVASGHIIFGLWLGYFMIMTSISWVYIPGLKSHWKDGTSFNTLVSWYIFFMFLAFIFNIWMVYKSLFIIKSLKRQSENVVRRIN